MPTFEEELTAVINRHSRESDSNTPDFILAQYLHDCLRAWNSASNNRERWYGVRHVPGAGNGSIERAPGTVTANYGATGTATLAEVMPDAE